MDLVAQASQPGGIPTGSTADGVDMLGRLCKGDDPRNGLNAGTPRELP